MKHGNTTFDHLTVRELGDLAAERGVSASSLLDRYEPQRDS
jgi:hypothetical protein